MKLDMTKFLIFFICVCTRVREGVHVEAREQLQNVTHLL